ncbi:MAG TPA: hypothetical protein VK806_07870, partial [Bacteroidia bacterium]|nr:hypothetical protein [Bacteroidia bacterium]
MHCKLYATGNGGATWNLISNLGEVYYAMNFYRDSATKTYKGVAVGYKGLVKRIVFNASGVSPYAGEVPINSPTAHDLRAVFAQATATGTINILVGGEEHNVYYTTNASASSATWTGTNVGTSIKKAAFVLGGGTNTMLPAVISDLGTLIRLKTSATAPSLVYADSSNNGFTDITEAGTINGNDSVYTINTGTGATTTILYAPASIPAGTELSETALGGSNPSGLTTMNSMAYAGNGNLTGTDSSQNKIYTGKITGSSIAWTDVSTNTHSGRLNEIGARINPSNPTGVFAVGDKGALYYATSSGSGLSFKQLALPTQKKIYAVALVTPIAGLLCGDSSALYQFRYLSGNSPTSVVVSVPVTNTPLYDVAVTASGTGYIVGAKGTELYMPVVTIATANLGVSAGVTDLKGVGIVRGVFGNAFAVGDQSNVWGYGGVSGMKINALYDPRFWAESFMSTNANEGYVVGDSGVIRRTDNGGVTWQTVLPELNVGGGVPDFKTVWTTSAGNAIVAGNGNFVGQSFPDNLTLSAATYSYTGPSGPIWYKARFNINFPNAGYLVGSGGQVLNLNVSGGALASTSSLTSLNPAPSSPDFHSIHVFRDNSFITVGGSGKAYYYNANNSPKWVDESPLTTRYGSFTWNDVYFRDDITGYIVGDSAGNEKGEIIKAIGTQTIQTPTAVFVWIAQPVVDGATANNIVTSSTQVEYNTVAFTGPYDGFIGGSYSNTFTGNPSYPYARLLNDRGEVFSELHWFDRDGRQVVSQTTKQHNYLRPAYSYSLYDALNRVIEVGQKTENKDTANNFNKIFGDTIMGFINPNIIGPNKFIAWIKDSTGPRTEVRRYYFDVQNILPSNVLVQQNLRNRTTSMTYSDTLRRDSLVYNNATHYSYDVHGDVATLIQEDSNINIPGQKYRRTDFQYDIVSNKMNEIDYENDSIDQYHERYMYDADNRPTQVFTSKDSVIWDCDAKYFYYAHGALARTELGDQQVQGIDYAYILQGKIKGMNSDQLDGTHDMGHDALQVAGNLNSNFARDAAGYSVKYFDKSSLYYGDYDAINKTAWGNVANRFEAYSYGSDLTNSRRDLFNGYITALSTSITQPQVYSQTNATQSAIILPQGTAYNYDQLDRLIDMKAYQNLNASTNTWGTGSAILGFGIYHNWFTYDANGNILTQKRADSVGEIFDSLTYKYNNNGGTGPTIQNRLYHVNDAVNVTGIDYDIKDEGAFTSNPGLINQANNYEYNASGQLAKDRINGIDTITWTVYGTIKSVIRKSGSNADNLIFDYDSKGYRIAKHVYTSSHIWLYDEYYKVDPNGNIVAIYQKSKVGSALTFTLIERDIYCTGRIGTERTPIQLIGAIPYSHIDTCNRYLRFKQYELANYIGNIISVISDRKIPRPSSINPTQIDHYEADIISSNDYYPFGMYEPGRDFESTICRYGFSGKEKDDELYGSGNEYNFGDRIYDPRLGRWLTFDRIRKVYTGLSPYSYAA